MAKMKVSGETPFKSNKDNFAIGYSASGYTLNYSVDKENWTPYSSATPANEVCIVNGVVPYMWFKLEGNTGEVEINV